MNTFPIHDGESRGEFVASILATGKATFTRLPDSQFTVCVLKFEDGWSVTGESVCVDPADYNQNRGESIALANATEDAKTHYWRTVGYMAMIGMTEISYEPK